MEKERWKIDDIDCQKNEITPYINVNICEGYISDVLEKYSKEEYVFMLMGGKTASKVFSDKAPEGKKIVGITLSPSAGVKISSSEKSPQQPLKVNEIHVNTKSREISAGAAVILDQVSAAAAASQVLGKNYRVLGADLTSRSSASVGGTFMTNGAGLKRVNFGENSLEVRINDGKASRTITDKNEIKNIAGTYGYTGIVEEVKLQIVETPQHDFRFAVTINNNAKDLADLIDFWGDKTDIKIQDGKIITDDYIVDGLELVTKDSLLAKKDPSSELTVLIQLLETSGKDSLVFITGYSHKEFLENEENWDDDYEVFLNKIPGTEIHPFNSVSEMRDIRESGPNIAKSQNLNTKLQHSESTDMNVVINRENLGQNSELVLQCYDEHKRKVLELLEKEEKNEVAGNIYMYGHLNPQGLDLHCRVTVGTEDESTMENVKTELKKYYNQLVQKIAGICDETDSKFTGGEKGAKSNVKILESLDGIDIPTTKLLQKNHNKQIKTIQESDFIFNWRAPKKILKENPAKLAVTI